MSDSALVRRQRARLDRAAWLHDRYMCRPWNLALWRRVIREMRQIIREMEADSEANRHA